jgi:hypothetical protein
MNSIQIKKLIKYFFFLFFAVFLIYLFLDYKGPEKITLDKSTVFGFNALKAKDLMIQTSDDSGNIWASRGMVIYKLNKGEYVFNRIAHVPTGFSVFWFRNFSLVRHFTLRPECIELVASANGSICAMSAGKIWFKSFKSNEFVSNHTLNHYNKGNQGIFNNGILQKNDSSLFYGEYFRNEKSEEVHIYESLDSGLTWHLQHVFQPNEIRHIHAIQKDPYTGNLWVCTGDNSKNSKIGYSDDNFKSIKYIGTNSEKFTATQLVFTPKHVYWGADPFDLADVGIFRWDRNSQVLDKITSERACFFYTTMLKQGTLVFTTDREATEFENDLFTRMVVIEKSGKVKTIKCGEWNKRDGFFRQYAKLRLPRQQSNSPYLIVSVLKHKNIDDSDLYLIDENELLKTTKNATIENFTVRE